MEQYITKLKTMALDCGFGTEQDNMIRDQIIFGVRSEKIREKLITEGDELTLDKTEKICIAYEYSQQQLKTMQGAAPSVTTTANVDAVKRGQRKPYVHQQSKTQSVAGPKKPSGKCRKCSLKHKGRPCPAKGQQCHACNGWNHWKVACLKKKEVHNISASEISESEYEIDGIIDGINKGLNRRRLFVLVMLCGCGNASIGWGR